MADKDCPVKRRVPNDEAVQRCGKPILANGYCQQHQDFAKLLTAADRVNR